MQARPIMLAVCVAGSVVLHLGVLLPEEPVVARRPAARVVTALSGWSAAPTPPGPAGTRPDTSTDLQTLDTLPPTGAGPSHTDTDTASEAATPAPDTPDASDTVADTDYLPRDQLSLGPVPRESIDLVYPEWAPSGHFRAVLTLFIDDQGVVRRVRFDEADETGLPPALEEAARQTFLRSTFTPGELDGKPIRSRLRIEVAYTTQTRSTVP